MQDDIEAIVELEFFVGDFNGLGVHGDQEEDREQKNSGVSRMSILNMPVWHGAG